MNSTGYLIPKQNVSKGTAEFIDDTVRAYCERHKVQRSDGGIYGLKANEDGDIKIDTNNTDAERHALTIAARLFSSGIHMKGSFTQSEDDGTTRTVYIDGETALQNLINDPVYLRKRLAKLEKMKR
ncbi:MAG: hypothetical protein IJ679_04625 [Lachnospiraceae bacterium]|nr:hypothetical protein [Lachnospiraceae bacterium]